MHSTSACIISLLGTEVSVFVAENDRKVEYTGLLSCCSPNFDISLKFARKFLRSDDDNHLTLQESTVHDITLSCSNVISISGRMEHIKKALDDEKLKSKGFAIDGEIIPADKLLNDEAIEDKNLKEWSDGEASSNSENNDKIYLPSQHSRYSKTNNGRGKDGWSADEMFNANKELGVKTSFVDDLSQYTTVEAGGTIQDRKRAEAIAQEILNDPASQRNAMLENDDEERNLDEHTTFYNSNNKNANKGDYRTRDLKQQSRRRDNDQNSSWRRKDFHREGTTTVQSNSQSFSVRSNTANKNTSSSTYVATTTTLTHTNNNAAQKSSVNTFQPPPTQVCVSNNNVSGQPVTQAVTLPNVTTPTTIVSVKNLTNSVPTNIKYKYQNNNSSFAATVRSTLPTTETSGSNSSTPSLINSSTNSTLSQTATTSSSPPKVLVVSGGANSPSFSVATVNNSVNSSHSTTVSTPARGTTPSSQVTGSTQITKFKFNPDATPFVPLRPSGNNIVSPSVTPINNTSVIVVPGAIAPQNVQFLPIQTVPPPNVVYNWRSPTTIPQQAAVTGMSTYIMMPNQAQQPQAFIPPPGNLQRGAQHLQAVTLASQFNHQQPIYLATTMPLSGAVQLATPQTTGDQRQGNIVQQQNLSHFQPHYNQQQAHVYVTTSVPSAGAQYGQQVSDQRQQNIGNHQPQHVQTHLPLQYSQQQANYISTAALSANGAQLNAPSGDQRQPPNGHQQQNNQQQSVFGQQIFVSAAGQTQFAPTYEFVYNQQTAVGAPTNLPYIYH